MSVDKNRIEICCRNCANFNDPCIGFAARIPAGAIYEGYQNCLKDHRNFRPSRKAYETRISEMQSETAAKDKRIAELEKYVERFKDLHNFASKLPNDSHKEANCGNCKRYQLCGRWSDKSEYHECYNGDGLTPLAAANARIAELEAKLADIYVGALVKPLVWREGFATVGDFDFSILESKNYVLLSIDYKNLVCLYSEQHPTTEDAEQAAYTWLCDFVRAACGKGEK